ncbi:MULTISPECIES: hypothetical protein [Calothrix]|nr:MULTISPECIES: hypothetical protein [Calothrix]
MAICWVQDVLFKELGWRSHSNMTKIFAWFTRNLDSKFLKNN